MIRDCIKNPELLREAKSNDVLFFGDDSFKFQRVQGGFCLTSTDSRIEQFLEQEQLDFTDSGFLIEAAPEMTYESCIRHVRIDGRALLSTNELIEAIKNSTFTIDKWSS
jgi:hypothetical protein